MSWSVAGIGRAEALRAKLGADFGKINCQEPEQAIKNKIASAVDLALAAFKPNDVVKVICSGSQTPDGDARRNAFRVEFEPVYGFVDTTSTTD